MSSQRTQQEDAARDMQLTRTVKLWLMEDHGVSWRYANGPMVGRTILKSAYAARAELATEMAATYRERADAMTVAYSQDRVQHETLLALAAELDQVARDAAY